MRSDSGFRHHVEKTILNFGTDLLYVFVSPDNPRFDILIFNIAQTTMW